ncbi:hypothetical protein RB195_014818 [Necator americanus]|uniref:Uncharacterized protein n=1 Tax=Necator americanus TaxID=51031 RepID=A0ABR1E280_NECAM
MTFSCIVIFCQNGKFAFSHCELKLGHNAAKAVRNIIKLWDDDTATNTSGLPHYGGMELSLGVELQWTTEVLFLAGSQKLVALINLTTPTFRLLRIGSLGGVVKTANADWG